MKEPFKHVDLSILHLDNSEGLDPIPLKATDPQEAARRRAWPKGTLVLDQQRQGMMIASEIANFPFEDPQAQSFALGKLAIALINTSWYSSGQNAEDVMRRVIDLPELADDVWSWRETRAGMLQKIQENMGSATRLSESLVIRHIKGQSVETLSRRFARKAGSAAVRMACLGLTPAPAGMSAHQAQHSARIIALDLIDQARYAHDSLGTHPSIAQLADDPREQWLRGAPTETRNAFDQAFETVYD